MTTASEAAIEKAANKEALKARQAEIDAKEKEANASRTGKGLRVFYGMTRGRNPVMIDYENWDDSKPETLPETLTEFMELRGLKDSKDAQKEIVRRLILGDNDILYQEASDPVSEFVEAHWSEDVKKQFRTVIRNYSQGANVSIDDAVELIKPGFVKSFAKSEAAA